MPQLLKWEWRYCKSKVWTQLALQLCYPVIIFVLYCFRKELLFQVTSMVFSLPEEVYAFLGLKSSIITGNIRFYMMFGAMFINVGMAWNACSRTLDLLQADERSGSISVMCNQWYSRKQLGMCKLLCSMIAFFVQNSVWYGITLLFTMIGSISREQRILALQAFSLIWLQSILVVGMLIILTFCLGEVFKYPLKKGMNWVNAFFIISLAVGNLYKLRDLYLWLVKYFQLEPVEILEGMVWLKYGYWLSPLSWLHPYGDQTGGMLVGQFCVCIILSMIGLLMGQVGYSQRRIAQSL